jgi:hypothetical protein
MKLGLGRARPLFAALGLLCSATTLSIALPTPAHAASNLPAPFVSRALDAVLLPVTPAVRSEFDLGRSEQGVLVLSTQPNGVAAKSGIRTGDVLSSVNGRRVTSPKDLDTAVYFWLKRNKTDFRFDGWRSGDTITPAAVVTMALFDLAIDLASVDSWISAPVTGFSYADYYEEYYEEVVEEYDVVEQYFEETVESEEYVEETTEYYEEYNEESYEEESVEEESYEEESVEEESYEEDSYEEEGDEGDDYEDDGDDYEE